MKAVNEKKYHEPEQQVDVMKIIDKLQDEYDNVYWKIIEDQIFIYRPLGRLEYKDLLNAELSPIEQEDAVCNVCILWPENYDFDECPAGVPTQIFNTILENSYLDSIKSKTNIVNYFREQMIEFDNQITCIISEAFPNFSIEEIESWDMAKSAKYLSMAEWKLNILRQVPIDVEKSNQMMSLDWYAQHAKNNPELQKEFENAIAPKAEDNQPVNNYVSGETIEERNARLKTQGVRKKTPEEIADLKRKFPEINWDAESNLLEDAPEGIDVLAPALRTGKKKK